MGAGTGSGAPTGAVAREIREKGPARVQSRRLRPPYPFPSGPARLPRGADTGPRPGQRRRAEGAGRGRPPPAAAAPTHADAGNRRGAPPPPATAPGEPPTRAPRAGPRGTLPAGRERRAAGRLLPRPRREPSPASHPSPTDPALRANPCPEVTDLICRLPLPTLFQHARGCSPWRPAADMGTAWREIYTFSPGFSRAGESSPDAAGTATLSRARAPLSGRTHSRAPCPSQRKENSPRGTRQLLRDRLRRRTGRLAAPVSATPGSGI